MPLYEYNCSDCEKILEIKQSIFEAPLTACPDCGNTNFKKLISKSSFLLNGSGWYADGYSSKPKESAPEVKKENKKDGM